MRSQEDELFGELCDKIANEKLTTMDMSVLESRCDIPCPGELDHESFKTGKIMILCLENSRIEELNQAYLHGLNKESKIYQFKSEDRFVHLSENVGEVELSYTETGNLASVLELKIDTPVILTKNISKIDGLLNGKRG